jgi:hypothetical protein
MAFPSPPSLSPPFPLVSRGQLKTGEETEERWRFLLYKKNKKGTSLTVPSFFSSLFPGGYLLPGLGFRCFLVLVSWDHSKAGKKESRPAG